MLDSNAALIIIIIIIIIITTTIDVDCRHFLHAPKHLSHSTDTLSLKPYTTKISSMFYSLNYLPGTI